MVAAEVIMIIFICIIMVIFILKALLHSLVIHPTNIHRGFTKCQALCQVLGKLVSKGNRVRVK